MSEVHAIPPDRSFVAPYLVQDDAAAALEFYKEAFGAVETAQIPSADGRVLFAEMVIGGGIVYLSDDFPETRDGQGATPQALGGSCVGMHFYVADCEATFNQAVAAGATPEMPPVDVFWGDRLARVRDPFGHYWSIATHVRDADPAEMEAAVTALASGESGWSATAV